MRRHSIGAQLGKDAESRSAVLGRLKVKHHHIRLDLADRLYHTIGMIQGHNMNTLHAQEKLQEVKHIWLIIDHDHGLHHG